MFSIMAGFYKRQFFWIPLVLASIDLVYFVLIPLLVVFAISPNPSVSWQSYLYVTAENIGLDEKNFVLFTVFLVSVFRVVLISWLKNKFTSSVSKAYTEMTASFVSTYFDAVSALRQVDNERFRKVINAETNNLFFGIVVSFSFAMAELAIVIAAAIVVLNVFGVFSLIGALPLMLLLGGFLYLIRKRSQSIGRQRSSSEQKRLSLVELLINSGYSIEKNSGRRCLQEKLHSTTKDFSEALGLQLVFPHLTKSVVDAVLLLALVIFVFNTIDLLGGEEAALLIGIGFRAVPALSRMSSYSETIRINKVGAQDALELIDCLEQSSVTNFECENVVKFLEGVGTSGIYIVKGPSGVGKTTAIKKWISSIDPQEIAYFDQGGFSSSTDIDDLYGLLNVKSGEALKEIRFLEERTVASLSDLSGGQSRYLQLAMLLTKNVPIIILDEPSVGLDAELKSNLEFMIKQKAKISKMIVITHDNDFINGLLTESKGELFEIKA